MKNVDRFSKYMKKYPELYSYLAKIVKNNIPKKVKKPFIVDLGVGPGFLSKEMHNKIPTAKIVGIDPSYIMLKKSKENVDFENFFLMIGSAEKIPIEDKSADVVVTRFTLTYWDNPREGFREIYRVLKPDGKIVLEELNRDFSRLRLFLIKIHMFLNFAGLDVIRYHSEAYETAYSIDGVKKLLSEAKFDITYLEGKKKDWKFIVVAKKK